MPSVARATSLVFLLLLPGNLPAQASHAAENPAAEDEFDARPDLLKPAPGPVRIAPPLASADKIAGATAGGKGASASSISPRRGAGIPLSPPGGADSRDVIKRPNGLPSMAAVVGGLAAVLGVFLLIAWLIRRTAPQGLTRLPNEAFEVLGRAPLAGRQNVHLLRCGNKLLLVSITPAGTETLTEITDSQEVDRLAGLCRQAGPHSSTAAFRQIFEQLAPRRANRAAFLQGEYADYDLSGAEAPEAMDWEHHNA